MKIKCDFECSFKIAKEIYDICINKFLILKNRKIRLNVVLFTVVLVIVWLLLTVILLLLDFSKVFYQNYSEISSSIIAIPITILIIYFVFIFLMFLEIKKSNKCTIVITEKYISDLSNSVTIKVEKKNIKGVVFSKNIIFILLDNSNIIFLPIKCKKEFMQVLNEKMPDIKVFNY